MALSKLCSVVAIAFGLAAAPSSAATIIHGTSSGNGLDLFDFAGSGLQSGLTKIALDIIGGSFVAGAAFVDMGYSYSIYYTNPPYSPDIDYGNENPVSEICSFGSGPIACDNGFGDPPSYLTNFLVGTNHLEFTVNQPRSYDRCGTVFNSICMEKWVARPGISATMTGPVRYKLTVSNLSAVPEPASWAMMIAGFGMIGAPTRKRGRALSITDGAAA